MVTKHPVQTYYVYVDYQAPLTRAKVKSSPAFLKLKREICGPRIGVMNPLAAFMLKDMGLDNQIVVMWPNDKMESVMEVMPLDRLHTRFLELVNGAPYQPFQIPNKYKVRISQRLSHDA